MWRPKDKWHNPYLKWKPAPEHLPGPWPIKTGKSEIYEEGADAMLEALQELAIEQNKDKLTIQIPEDLED